MNGGRRRDVYSNRNRNRMGSTDAGIRRTCGRIPEADVGVMDIIKAPQGARHSHRGQELVYKCSIAQKGTTMKDMIYRKNRLLLSNGGRMQEIKKIAHDLKNAKMSDSGMTLFLNLLGDKLYSLSLWGDDMIIEGNVYLPEAEEGSMDDEERDQWNPGVVPPTEEEMAKAREVYGDD